VSGHRRFEACKRLGKYDIPVIVRDLTDDEAILTMVDSNLHRETILPSEKAFAYKMKMDALRHQGTSCQDGTKRSDEAIAENADDSARQIQRYIRLTYLIPEILEMVDNSVLKEKDKLQIALRPAVELSYLTEQEQRDLNETMMTEDRTPSHAQAIKMRKFSQDGRLNMDVIFSIMQEEKPNQREQFKIPRDRISKYFAPGTPAQKIEDTIVKALELYQKRQRGLQR
jgi:ParB family chromosome partitioning protein